MSAVHKTAAAEQHELYHDYLKRSGRDVLEQALHDGAYV